MSVPSNLQVSNLQSFLDTDSRLSIGPNYGMFGSQNFNGVYCNVDAAPPSGGNDFLGYVHVAVQIGGAPAAASIYNTVMVEQRAFVYVFDELLTTRQARILFYPTSGLLRYNITFGAIS